VLSVVLALGCQRMAGRKAIVKNLSSVETLGSASVIASDKTGTLTRSEMTIQRIVTASGEVEVTGTGFGPEGAVMRQGRPVDDPSQTRELHLPGILEPVAGGGDPARARAAGPGGRGAVPAGRLRDKPLTLVQWGICVAMASIILWVEEIRKLLAWLVRR
jgi:hypothetical protein